MAIIIKPTTDEAISKTFTANSNNTGLLANGLTGSETVKLQVFDETINDFVDALIDGEVPMINAENNMLAMYQDVFTYRVIKSATANLVGVAIYQNLLKVGGYIND